MSLANVAAVDDLAVTLARGEGVLGEVVLRRRRGLDRATVIELIINGVFVMDTGETSSERLLADVVLDRLPAPRRILLGGLGLGVTLAELLADVRVEQVDVVEIEPVLVSWLRSGIVAGARAVVEDPRVEVRVGNLLDMLRDEPAGSFDAILVDVDNGPEFLVHPANADLYERPALAAAARVLAPDGVLAVWSSTPSSRLADALTEVVGSCDEIAHAVIRDGREVTYYVYVASRLAIGSTTADDVRHD